MYASGTIVVISTNNRGLKAKEAVWLTLSSPRVDSASSSGSPGVWMVTDLSPRLLLSRLLERCRSLRSLEDKTTHRVRGGAAGLKFFYSSCDVWCSLFWVSYNILTCFKGKLWSFCTTWILSRHVVCICKWATLFFHVAGILSSPHINRQKPTR